MVPLSRLNIEVWEDLHDVTPLNLLQQLNTAYTYHNYKHLAYTLYKPKEKQQAQINITPKRGRPLSLNNCAQMVATKTLKHIKQSSNYKWKIHNKTDITK